VIRGGAFSFLICWEALMGALELILLVVIVLLLLGALPAWPYSRSWGYAPSGGLGLVLVILLLLFFFVGF
jgi:hypothetical protein